MRRAALVVLVLAGIALAEESTKLPFNPWESAKAGDWETLAVESKFEGQNAAALKKAFRQLELVTYTVRGADASEVKIAFDTVPEILAQEERIATIFSRTVAPAFDRLLDVKGEVKDVKLTDEKRTVLGRELGCTKIAYTTISSRGVKSENAVWFSKDVKALGLVELVTVVPIGQDARCTLTYRVAGFGSKDRVDAGKRPEDMKK